MAIVYGDPLKDWYFNNVSEWTLDYPPYFAYFEYVIAIIAKKCISTFPNSFDAEMLKIEEHHLATLYTTYFMRSSVIISDFCLIAGVWYYLHVRKHDAFVSLTVTGLIVFNSGLLLVDHIHFQYNGMLLGLLIACCACSYNNHYIVMTVIFSILVLLKRK